MSKMALHPRVTQIFVLSNPKRPTGPEPESGGSPAMQTQDTDDPGFFLYTHTSEIFAGCLMGHSLYRLLTLLQGILNIVPLHACAERNHSVNDRAVKIQ